MRTLVLSFEDNEAAELFVRMLDQVQRREYPGVTNEAFTEMGMILEQTTMDAMIARPTLACNCVSMRQKGKIKPLMNFTLTPRFRWWVHRKCKRPTSYIVKYFIANMIGGHRDLLSEIIPEHEEVSDHLVPTDRQVVNQFQARQRR